MKTKQERVAAIVAKVNDKPEDWSWGLAYYNAGLEMFPRKTRITEGNENLDPVDNDENIQRFINFVTD